MNFRVARILSVIAVTTMLGCIALSAYLAAIELNGSRQVGGGAAQGDLGFFMILRIVTPAMLFAMCFSAFLKALTEESGSRRFFLFLYSLASLGLAWNWFFLLKIWRA